MFARLGGGPVRSFDWIVELDGDELQGYPKGVSSMPAFFDELERAFNTIHGVWRDRVTADGSLQATDPRLSLFDQFPVTCSLRVVGKIMARHYDIPVTDGNTTVTPAGHPSRASGTARRTARRATRRCPCGTQVGRRHCRAAPRQGQDGARPDRARRQVEHAILAYLTQHNNSFDLATLFRRHVCCDWRRRSAGHADRNTAPGAGSSTRPGATTAVAGAEQDGDGRAATAKRGCGASAMRCARSPSCR